MNAERLLEVDGESTEGKVAFKEKSLDLGNFPVGISMERTGRTSCALPSSFCPGSFWTLAAT